MLKCHIPGTQLFKSNKFYEDISISEGLSRKELISFSNIDERDVVESIHKKLFQMKQNMIQLRIH